MKMKKLLVVVVVGLVLVGLVVAPALADKHAARRPPTQGRLRILEKDPSNWRIVRRGASGMLKYNLSGPRFDFVFKGKKLEAGWAYTLLYYPDPWPGTNLRCLGGGTAYADSSVYIAGSVDTGDLPRATDANYPVGAKIWLVLSNDVNCINSQMTGWNPTEYLFEHNLITFDDTDGL